MHRPKTFHPPWIDFFTRPCPYYIKQHTTFPKFPLLPKEIQLMVWAHIKPKPRAVYIGIETWNHLQALAGDPLEGTIRLAQMPPAVLRATFEARCAGLKIYQPFLDVLLGQGTSCVYFNFDLDYLQISLDAFELICWAYAHIHIEDNQLPMIKRLVVNMQNIKLGENSLVNICKHFSGLTKLYIIEADTEYTKEGVPYTYHPKQKSFRHDWTKLRRQIKAPIPFVRDRLTDWSPPILIIGSRSQWKWRRARAEQRKEFILQRERTAGGDMDWKPTATFPRLDYVPMYQVADPKVTYNLAIEPAPEEKRRSKDLVTANILYDCEGWSEGEEMEI
ncbi:uncharacterized protein LY89DRAFT_721492 [Mollisia scopiformis]|uniref:2EXR domain-containing protein n=1 Tax=Mollisia scopiformis TaxID=149040 RepID=A0A194X0Y0_MOLSC|nr:uncharacterized protein LY89DRAFT_721492 [Mollisia scopiformis]KUJ13517.1 hypothetical protein LY89DRAFT_721492 [Mollisia scopiformis]